MKIRHFKSFVPDSTKSIWLASNSLVLFTKLLGYIQNAGDVVDFSNYLSQHFNTFHRKAIFLKSV